MARRKRMAGSILNGQSALIREAILEGLHGGRRFMSSAGGLAARERSEDVDELTMADRG